IREGMFIKPAMDVLTIGQIDTVWVIAEVFERQIGWVSKGQTVDMNVAAYPEKSWQGVVDYIYPILDEKTRTLRVRIRFDNKDGLLKPNMFSRLTIRSSFNTESLLVKREALIRNGQMERVVKALGDGKFKSVAVKTGSENSEYIQILEGLNENDQIVTSAQFLIDSESSLTASFERMQEPQDIQMDTGGTAMDMSSIKKEPKKILDNQAWVKGKVLKVMTGDSKLTLQHEPVDSWGWPQMKMDFPVAESVNIKIFDTNEEYNFLVEKHASGSIQIIDFNKKVQP
ncbi:MAG: efflux RND transporter periplasmic adaptor subunit, partial [Gammaproteobacteria bacterium]|nr:efflux RND transporter periplasmic adaptor subunit [Gammaproteobacteria bacterium]